MGDSTGVIGAESVCNVHLNGCVDFLILDSKAFGVAHGVCRYDGNLQYVLTGLN